MCPGQGKWCERLLCGSEEGKAEELRAQENQSARVYWSGSLRSEGGWGRTQQGMEDAKAGELVA